MAYASLPTVSLLPWQPASNWSVSLVKKGHHIRNTFVVVRPNVHFLLFRLVGTVLPLPFLLFRLAGTVLPLPFLLFRLAGTVLPICALSIIQASWYSITYLCTFYYSG